MMANSDSKARILILATIAAVLVVGCGPPSNPEADRALLDAAEKGNIEAVKQHLAAGTDVNVKNEAGVTPLHQAAYPGHKEIDSSFWPLDGKLAVASHRVAMTKTHFRLGALLIFAAILLNNLTSPHRYTRNSTTTIIDGVTGKVWVVSEGKLSPVPYE